MTVREQTSPPYMYSAGYYDELMEDIDYEGWADYLLDIAGELKIDTNRIIDFSCGTGTLLHYLSRSADTVKGIDISETMIRQAALKYPEQTWSVGDMMTTYMPSGFTLGINVHDSLNYITEKESLNRYLNNMQNSCLPGQSLMFDFALPVLIDRYFKGQEETKRLKDGGILYRRHEYLEREKICLTILEITRDKQCVTEIHRQRILPLNELKKMFIGIPRQNLLFLEEFTFQKAKEDSERLLTVIYYD